MEFVGANSFARNCLNVRMNSHPHLLLFLGSGLGYYSWEPRKPQKANSLNPFSFRAGVLRGCFYALAVAGAVSIPFHSGLGYYNLQGNIMARTSSQSLFIQGWGTTKAHRNVY